MRSLFSAFIAVSLLLGGFIAVSPAQAATLTESQIQAIVSLVASFGADADTVKNVEMSLRGQTPNILPSTTPPTQSSSLTCIALSYDLHLDRTDAQTNGEVTKLQQFLAQNPSTYPEGRITGYFGPATERAVQRWQAANGVVSSGDPDSTGYGYVGPRTRAAMGKDCGSGTSTVTPPTTGSRAPSIINGTSPMITFSASPNSIARGQSSTVSWRTSNVQRCVLKYDSSEETVAVNGSKIVSPAQTTYYTLWCAQDSGVVGKEGPSASHIISVSVSYAIPSISVTAVASTSVNAQYANLPKDSQIWIVNASSSQPYKAQSTPLWTGGSGSIAIPIPSALPLADYVLRVVNYYDQSKTIAQSGLFQAGVPTPTAPTCTLKAIPNAVTPNIPTLLSWTSTDATSAMWLADTSGKDNIPPPSGTPATSGSMSFIPLSSLLPGQTSIPSVTLQVTGPGGTSTCTTYITVVSPEQVAFDNTVFTQTTPTPTISGTASGVNQVGIVLSNEGGKVYSSGLIPVVNGRWSDTVSPPLATGAYMIYVYNAKNDLLSAGGYLNVTNPQPAPTCTLTPSSSDQVALYLPLFSIKLNGSVALTWTSQNADSGIWNSGVNAGTSGSSTFVHNFVPDRSNMVNNYSINFTGPGGSTTCSTTVYVDYKG